MNVSAISAMVGLSFKDAIRAKWLILYSIVFFLLAVNVPEVTLNVFGASPADYITTYLTLLVTLSFPYLPLLALPLGSTSIVEERESGVLQQLLTNPLSRSEVLFGRLLGLVAATTAVVVLGYGIAAFVAYGTNVAGYGTIGRLMVIAILLNLSMVATALFISVVAKRKVTALGAAIFLWFIMTVISNLSSTGVIISILKSPSYLLPLVLLNPVQAASILGLLQLNLSNSQLGIAMGIEDSLGPSGSSILLTCLGVWIIFFIVAGMIAFHRQDIN